MKSQELDSVLELPPASEDEAAEWPAPGGDEAEARLVSEDSGRWSYVDLPSGTGTVLKTLLISDLVDSTKLFEQLGDERAAEVLRHHDRLARDLLEDYGGREIDKTDGFLLLFDRPMHAVLYSQAYHEALDGLSREEGVTLASRVGIHVGKVVLYENTPHDVERGAKPLEVEGLAKPLAARLMSLALGRQTLMSLSAYKMVQPTLDDNAATAEGLRWLEHGNYHFKGLEHPVEVFEVGREGLSPLVAPPSAEKVRQAFEVEEMALLREHDPARKRWRQIAVALLLIIAVVSLVRQVRDLFLAPRLRPSISVLGFHNVSNHADLDWLSAAFSEMLNTELATGGTLRIVSGESVARMRIELDLPKIASLAPETLTAIRRHIGADYVIVGSYVVLGTGEPRQVRVDFRLQETATGETLTVASRSGSEEDLFTIVEQTGAYLRAELGLAPVQAGAARASISASPEATRLYVEGLGKLRSYDALTARDFLERAIEKDSEFALAHAALSDVWTALGYDLHAAASAKQALDLSEGLPRQEALSIEGRFYETSLQWEKAIGTYRTLLQLHPDDLDSGLRLVEAQRVAGQGRDALATVALLRALPKPLRDDARIDLAEAEAASSLAESQLQLEAADAAIRKGLEQGARNLVANAWWLRGRALRWLQEPEGASAAMAESRRLFTEVGDLGGAARVLNAYGVMLKVRGDFSGAKDFYEQSLAIHQKIGDKQQISTLQNNLAVLSTERGELDAAKQILEESLALVREIGDRIREGARLENLGWVLMDQGDLQGAEDMAAEALTVNKAIGNRHGVAWNTFLKGQIAFARGAVAEARTLHGEALDLCDSIGEEHLRAGVLNGLGEILQAQGNLAGALGMLDEAEAIRTERGEIGYLEQGRLFRAAVLLDLDHLAEARTLARGARAALLKEGRLDDARRASDVLAKVLLAEGNVADARTRLDPGPTFESQSQNPRVKLALTVTRARLSAAAGDRDRARGDLVAVRDEARRLGLVGLELEARFALAKIFGDPTLAAVAAAAREHGFELLARKALAAAKSAY